MTIKTVKYSCLILFLWLLSLLIYDSVFWGRADILSYYLFLTSFFFILLFLFTKYGNEITGYVSVLLIISGIVISVAGLYRMLQNQTVRASGLLGDRVLEADAAAGIIVFLICLFLVSEKRLLFTAVISAAIYLCSVYVILLRVRTAYAALFLSGIMLIAFLIGRRKYPDGKRLTDIRKRTIITACIIVLSFITSIYFPVSQSESRKDLGKTVASMFSTGETTNSVRLNFWNASLKMFYENPFTGIGAGMWTGKFPKYYGELYNDRNIDVNSSLNPHNDYLEFMSEFGISGLFYALFLFTGFFILFRKSSGNISYLPFFMIVSCYSVTSFFNFTKDGIFSVLLLLVSLALAYKGNNSLQTKMKLHSKIFISSLSLVLIIAGSVLVSRIFLQRNYLEAMNLKAKGDYEKMFLKLGGISKLLYPVDMNGMPLDYYCGAAYFELKDFNRSLICFEDAEKLMPQYPSVISNKASALYKSGKKNEAVNLLLYIKNTFPNYVEPVINLLSVYANEKMDSEALNLIREISERKNDSKFIKNYIVFLEIKNYYEKKGL